ncbi:MAG: HI0074 family nucleotidyltransferase substrate-binding subunit [Elusimicrobiota bacterium]
MKKAEVILAIEKLKKAFKKLEESVKITKDELHKDGVIQRFEFTAELLWKTLKMILEYNSVDASGGPKMVIKQAFKFGYVPDDEIILDIMEDRTLSSHIYDEKTSNEIFERIAEVYLKKISEMINHIETKIQ